MGDVKRYQFYSDGMMCIDSDGEWVQFEDFDATLAREAALREELAKTKDALRDIAEGSVRTLAAAKALAKFTLSDGAEI